MTLFGWELSRILKWLLILAVIVFIFKNPTGAAAEFHRFLAFLDHVMNSIITFVNSAAS
jgi:hypothetical protein